MNGWILSDPKDIKFLLSNMVGPYSANVMNYAPTWEDKCPEIEMSTNNSTYQILFYADYTVDNGTYATTYHHNDNYHTITFYKAFTSTSDLYRNETIVHEVGHALGLAHCDVADNNVSVMRAEGVNGKAYPLADDMKGIAALY